MIEVIRKSEKQTVECSRCRAVLAYSYIDVKNSQDQRDYYTYITCPECNNEIRVNTTGRQVPFWERER